jgi:hypothetical protein
MAPRKKRHNALWRTIFDSIPIEGGGYKAKLSIAKLAIALILIASFLISLQLTGALSTIGKIVQAVMR